MILRLEDVCKNYGLPRLKIKVIKNISYQFESNKVYAITGKKFSGKTLLINLIGTLEEPSSGYITLDNISYIKKKDKDISKIRNTYFGYVLPYLKLNKNLDIIENITIPIINNKIDKKSIALNILEYVGINNKRKLDINNLSELDRIRILLARALVNNPKILLIDDELDILSSNNQKEIISLLKKIANDDKIVIVTTKSKTIIDNSDEVLNIISGTIKRNEYENNKILNI